MKNTSLNMNIKKLVVVASILAFCVGAFTANAYEKVTYHHWDALGSPLASSDATGHVIWKETYQPYGETIQNPPEATNNTRGYTGHVRDAETNLTYMGARYYDPIVGRFYGVDPKAFDEDDLHSFNRYTYGNNNPYRYTDPDGRNSNDITRSPTKTPLLEGGGGAGGGGYGGPNPFSGLFSRIFGKGGNVVENGVRGRASEQRVLKDMGLQKNTQKVSTREGNAVPDAVTKGSIVEIKDTKCVNCTRQIRIETGAAENAGKESVLVTGTNTRISERTGQVFDRIIRRDDLGPK